jgi:hypothetical protein
LIFKLDIIFQFKWVTGGFFSNGHSIISDSNR